MIRRCSFILVVLFFVFYSSSFAVTSIPLDLDTHVGYSNSIHHSLTESHTILDIIVAPPMSEQHGTTVQGSNRQQTTNVIDRIIGSDDRFRINNTNQYPWSAAVQITYNLPGNPNRLCSGWMLGASTIATAAHCIYDDVLASYGSQYILNPGRNGSTVYWSCSGIMARFPQAWADSVNVGTPNRDYDWGVIDLDCRVGEETGVLGFHASSEQELDNRSVFATGYPGVQDHPSQPPQDVGTSMWTSGGQISDTSTAAVLFYSNDTTPGHSGGPIWQVNNIPMGCSEPCVVVL